MYDYETIVQQLQDRPAELRAFQQNAPDRVLMRAVWHAMFFSGMLPMEQWDRPIVEAAAAGQQVACVDMPETQQAQLAECVFPVLCARFGRAAATGQRSHHAMQAAEGEQGRHACGRRRGRQVSADDA
jgi:hypothetical protein